MQRVSTETVTLIALKVNLPIAREQIASTARSLGLTLEYLEEKPRILSAELNITLSGEVERIDDFRSALGGRGASSGDPGGWNPLNWPFEAPIDGATKKLQRKKWVRDRLGASDAHPPE